jgi:hypothetical protein
VFLNTKHVDAENFGDGGNDTDGEFVGMIDSEVVE